MYSFEVAKRSAGANQYQGGCCQLLQSLRSFANLLRPRLNPISSTLHVDALPLTG
jgi:hypothetical protein